MSVKTLEVLLFLSKCVKYKVWTADYSNLSLVSDDQAARTD